MKRVFFILNKKKKTQIKAKQFILASQMQTELYIEGKNESRAKNIII